MAAKKIAGTDEIYQFKITLLGTKPPIWRRVLVPSNVTLKQMHEVIQVAMGWTDSHLHEFKIGNKRFGQPDPDDGFMGLPPVADERKLRLASVLGVAGAKARYTYDFGDGWTHAIVVEKVLAPDPKIKYPVCTDGKRNCPPEDCGGVGGFKNLLEALADPDHESHDDLTEWIGEFDAEYFSVDDVNGELKRLRL